MTEKIVIGVDVGGTFTDILAFEEKTGRVSVAKTPSTKEDQSKGFLEGILKTCLLYTSPSPRDRG